MGRNECGTSVFPPPTLLLDLALLDLAPVSPAVNVASRFPSRHGRAAGGTRLLLALFGTPLPPPASSLPSFPGWVDVRIAIRASSGAALAALLEVRVANVFVRMRAGGNRHRLNPFVTPLCRRFLPQIPAHSGPFSLAQRPRRRETSGPDSLLVCFLLARFPPSPFVFASRHACLPALADGSCSTAATLSMMRWHLAPASPCMAPAPWLLAGTR